MKTNLAQCVASAAALFFCKAHGYCQGSFANLSFENPILPLNPDPTFMVPVTNALPGWAAYVGGIQLDRVVYNTVSLGAAAVSLHGPGSLEPAFDGNYCVILQVQVPGGTPNAAISQTGEIPPDALSVVFYTYNLNIALTFAGQYIATLDLGSGGNPNGYHRLVGDISQFGGQTGELRFTAVNSSGRLDLIQFSNQPIPEPGIVGLIVLGTLFLGWRMRGIRSS